ncbi:MAG: YihY/virulence factor BrkB family protein [Planctomycetota bacterium]|nr:MAG: YihY/virulence factor BrkB family protein [Planctomycetota bacterium]REJ90621.1 MAG: YihY/virulence factor BrkB family protein [Planctomycetota bacterium]REK21026.1 MAG: YihY/virulence factor BrkB family protein [Planctomycetota bacterium]REK38844.1 MAG: YihY/virulence factor BrkB family protein [Planctomycetota bacterium]
MFQLIKQAFAEFSEDKCMRMAAALAYYTVFSLAPLMIIVMMICGLIWDPSDVEGLVQQEIRSVVGENGAEQVRTMLRNASQSDRGILASVLSGVMLLVGATGLVGQLQGALNDAWEVKPDPEQGGLWNFVTKRLLSFGMICGIAFLLLVSLIASSVLAAAGDTIAGWLPQDVSQGVLMAINLVVSLAVIVVLFGAMFKFLPDAKVAWSDVAFGAAVTGVLFVVGKFAIGAYLGSKNMESTYGAAGSLALILIWVYYSSMIFLFGAELTQVWAKQRGSGVWPAEGAVRVVEKSVRADGAEETSKQRERDRALTG